MTPNGSMGLNEVVLGIPVPRYWGLLMARLIGGRGAEGLLLSGRMAGAEEAAALGLVDRLVPAEALIEVRAGRQSCGAGLAGEPARRVAVAGLAR
jgi:3,2-trans-enoyl-CoA isomerase